MKGETERRTFVDRTIRFFREKSTVSLLTGIAYQATNTLLSLILPYLLITGFGSETNGLLASVSQLFVYLSLLEGGISAAATQALYRPLSAHDKDAVSAVMAATAKSYCRTGIIYIVIVSGIAVL